MDISAINYLAFTTAAIISFALGSIWYTVLFGKTWQREVGLTEDTLAKANMVRIYGSSFLLILAMSFGMAMLIQGHEGDKINTVGGLFHGLYVGLFFAGPSIGINYIYQRKSLKLWLIDAGYQILFLCIMGATLGAWH